MSAASGTSTKIVVGRLAPSPTGPMHLGNARTALLAWLSARAQGGRVVLRLEDLDAPRVRPGAAEGILEDFARLGLSCEEGPAQGGPASPYLQSQRFSHYESTLALLANEGRSFPCACSRADLARAASAPHQGEEGPQYPGTCREVAPDRVRAQARNRGKQVAFRFRSDPEPVGFDDLMVGPVTSRVDDFVLWRADGVPSYQLAVVVDDAAMGVTEVVRGDDLLSSTARQLALFQAIGAPPPRYGHVPLVLAPGGERLAKRNRPAAVRDLLARGIEPEALVGALAASAGLCPPGTRARPVDLVSAFAWSRLNPRAVVIDPESLESHPS